MDEVRRTALSMALEGMQDETITMKESAAILVSIARIYETYLRGPRQRKAKES